MNASSHVCLDTDFISEYLRGQRIATNKMDQLLDDDSIICTTPITLSELFFGAYRRNWGEKRIQLLQNFASRLGVIPFEAEEGILAGWLRAQLVNQGIEIGYADTAIAAIVITNEIPLVTRNIGHFENINHIEALYLNKKIKILLSSW
ncbi:MAG: type II toxin-antitoxin system VapC family toxin [Candidatus Hermodarchaeota archaeon]